MATPTEQVVAWCTNCERRFLMDAHCAPELRDDDSDNYDVRIAEHPCPVCPLTGAYHRAADRARAGGPWLLATDLNENTMQRTMNEAAAQGWILREFQVGHVLRQVADYGEHPEHPEGGPQYVCLFQRDDYDREAHRDALVRRNDAELALLKKRREVELALAEFALVPATASNGRPS